ncbi:MAG: 4'-phosphopantetheinyl transferase superfamily protein [Tenuifilum sp.]|nr:4'-phosphopantetheinyl transferase superfamily protein [Bacteroidales bacterium]HOK61709.1 4'-phosphopantetheinyl transferase superfamily protein [Tenuifilum sp.]MBP9029026.1 4'-phosphopantetheinyl transferase superfamily protein [Bacteroidales bacterium]HOK86389.1 4'-phosphopantetheinyl transferase superfamily protein [Tenuifilum sp.]HON69898.1 4'-phosphopantetheinyl transferase superfamily protein [Tenuifilum sp.]
MPKANSISHDDIRIATWLITESVEELITLTGFSAPLPKSESRQREQLATAALLQSEGLPASYSYDQEGRPIIPESNVFISITHTDGLVAIAYSTNQPVGVDVEHLGRDFKRVSGKYLTEHESLQSIQYSDEHFALTWCAKESIYKLPWPKSLVFSRDIEVIFESETLKRCWLFAKVQNGTGWKTIKVFFTFINQYCLTWVGMNSILNGNAIR